MSLYTTTYLITYYMINKPCILETSFSYREFARKFRAESQTGKSSLMSSHGLIEGEASSGGFGCGQSRDVIKYSDMAVSLRLPL
jgi:hypothetical protein